MTIFISLGSSCLVASVLQRLKLRTEAGFFDWTWNQIYGLDLINKQIQDDFRLFKNFNELKKIKENEIVYKNYPHFKFFHHDILDPTVFQTFQRRLERFEKYLHEEHEEVIYVYFRTDEHKNSTLTVLRDEVLEFKRLVQTKNYKIIIIFRTDTPCESPFGKDIDFYTISIGTNTANPIEMINVLKSYGT